MEPFSELMKCPRRIRTTLLGIYWPQTKMKMRERSKQRKRRQCEKEKKD